MINVWTWIKARVGRRLQCFVGRDPADLVTVEWKHGDWNNWYAWQTLRLDEAERMIAAYRRENRFDWRIKPAANSVICVLTHSKPDNAGLDGRRESEV